MNTDQIILEKYISQHANDAVRILERLDIEAISSILNDIPDDLNVKIINRLEPFIAVKCLERLGPLRTAAFAEKLDLAVVLNILRQSKPEFRQEVLDSLNKELSVTLERKLQYPQGSAGALADPFILTLTDDVSIEQGLDKMRSWWEKVIYYIYIVNRDYILTGVINLREMMFSAPQLSISDVMQTRVVSISPFLNYKAIINHPGWQEYHTLPVTEESGTFLGVIRYENLRQIEKEIRSDKLPQHAIIAGNALGELYQIGLTALIRGALLSFKVGTSENKLTENGSQD